MPSQPTQTAPPPATPATSRPGVNRLLQQLPADVQQRLLSQSTRVALKKEALLTEAGTAVAWVYLPCSGLVSLQMMTQDAETVEVAMVGNEGIAGVPLAAASTIAAHTAVVVIVGEAHRLRADALQTEFERSTAPGSTTAARPMDAGIRQK